MCRLTYQLARDQVLSARISQRQPDRSQSRLRAEVEQVAEFQLVPVARSGQEVRDCPALALHEAPELRDHYRFIKPQVEDGEAVARVPPAALDPCAASRQGRVLRRLVAEGHSGEGHVRQAVDAAQQRGIRQELYEDAFGEAVDRAQYQANIALTHQVDGLVVIEERVWREKPIMGGLRTEHLR